MREFAQGACLCCGAQRIVETSDTLNQREADLRVTAMCDCGGAERARNMVHTMRMIDDITGEDATDAARRVNELLRTATLAVEWGEIIGARVTLADGSDVHISMGKRGLNVRRTSRSVTEAAQPMMSNSEMGTALGAVLGRSAEITLTDVTLAGGGK